MPSAPNANNASKDLLPDKYRGIKFEQNEEFDAMYPEIPVPFNSTMDIHKEKSDPHQPPKSFSKPTVMPFSESSLVPVLKNRPNKLPPLNLILPKRHLLSSEKRRKLLGPTEIGVNEIRYLKSSPKVGNLPILEKEPSDVSRV